MRYLLWPAALLVAAVVYVFFAGLGQHPAPRKSQTHRNCRQLSTSPKVMLCRNRGYIVQDGKWSDIGPATPLPGVPAR